MRPTPKQAPGLNGKAHVTLCLPGSPAWRHQPTCLQWETDPHPSQQAWGFFGELRPREGKEPAQSHPSSSLTRWLEPPALPHADQGSNLSSVSYWETLATLFGLDESPFTCSSEFPEEDGPEGDLCAQPQRLLVVRPEVQGFPGAQKVREWLHLLGAWGAQHWNSWLPPSSLGPPWGSRGTSPHPTVSSEQRADVAISEHLSPDPGMAMFSTKRTNE